MIEKAIRAALEKGNPEDRSFRQRVYRSAEQALVRTLSARTEMDDQTKQERMHHLANVVASIETEFTPVIAPKVDADDIRTKLTPKPTDDRLKSPIQEPRFETLDESRWSRSTDSGHGETEDSSAYTEPVRAQNDGMRYDDNGKASNSLFRRLVTAFVLITIIALLIMFGWTAWNSSLFGNGADTGLGPVKISQTEDSANAPPQMLDVGDGLSENWITIFEPKDASSVQASDGLIAQLRGSGDTSYLNISNTTNATQGEASFEIGRGVLDTLRGRKIVFNIQAKTADGLTSQMAASCSLAGMGECQWVRFRLDGQMTENLMIVQLADTPPEASGTLSIVPDLEKTGNPVEISGIRVRIEQ